MNPHEVLELPDLLALYDREQRRDIIYPDMAREVRPHVVRYTRSAPGRNFILYSDLAGADIDATIHEEVAYFSGLGQSFEWKVYSHDRPENLKERLVEHGFTLDAPDAIMLLDLQQAQPALFSTGHVDVRPVTKRQGLGDVIQVLAAVWERNFDWVWDRLGTHLEIPGYLKVYVAYVDNVPASVAWVYFHTGSAFAGLWGGSTRMAYRHHGLYSALLAVRAREARRRGMRFLTVDASPMSAPILAKHGFIKIATAWACEMNIEESA